MFGLWWDRNPEAMTRLLSGWIKQISLSRLTETLLLTVAICVFEDLDWGALRVKQMFATEIKRLRTRLQVESDEIVEKCVEELQCRFPEIQEL